MIKRTQALTVLVGIALALAFMLTSTPVAQAGSDTQSPKYVFFFIGDGMAAVQMHVTEAYLASLEADDTVSGGVKVKKLEMSKFPVVGNQLTFANNRLITGSAAAGTAMACGRKTDIGVIGKDPSLRKDFVSIAELAKQAGKKVGIVSSVSIDHATPAAFYANVPSRSLYYEISQQLAASDFDYFAGGGLKKPEQSKPSAWEALSSNGYQVVKSLKDLAAVPAGQKVYACSGKLSGGGALYYDLDRSWYEKHGDDDELITLSQFTRQGVRLLDNPKGFFLMVEGGKIDWACHANDARAVIDDTIELDNAVKVALDFYRQHPEETLIVVTGDHECGGLTMGFAHTPGKPGQDGDASGYLTHFEILAGQKLSYEGFAWEWEKIKPAEAPADIDADLRGLIKTYIGIAWKDFTDRERSRLEEAYDYSVGHKSKPDDYYAGVNYGSYDPLAVTCTHILNRRAGIDFTSYSHTAVPVPVLAKGAQASLFAGNYDNTDVARKIARAMGLELDN